MKILHVTDSFAPQMGGIENQVRQLALHQAHAHQVTVFTTTPAARGAHGRSVERDGPVTVYRLADRMPLGMPVHPRAAAHIDDVLAAVRPDVIHLHMGGTAPSTQAILRHLDGWPRVLTVHSVWTPWVTRTYRLLAGPLGMDRVAVTAGSRMVAARVQPAVPQPVHVVGCGIDTAAWRVADAVDHPGFHAVLATRFAPRKRVLPLLRILADAHQLAPTLTATIAGTGPEWEQARRLASDWDWLHLPGRLDAAGLKDLYARADAFVQPSVLEAFSVAALEAQCAGLPLVVHAQSGAAERVQVGVNGLLADDDAGFTAAVARLASAPGEVSRMKEWVRGHTPPFDWADITAQYQAIYHEVRG